MKARTTWILIADGSRAKVFEDKGDGAGLSAVSGLMFDQEALQAQDIMADKPGRTFSSVGTGRSGYEPHTDPVDDRERRFMKAMAERLDEQLRNKAFSHLVIAAAPAALGEIRPYLSKALQDVILAELPKDLTKVPTEKLAAHFEGVLPS